MTRAASVVTICLFSGALAVPALADDPVKQRGQDGAERKAAQLAAAQRADEGAATATSAGGQPSRLLKKTC